MSDRLSGVNNMTHVGLENDLTPPEHLVAMAGLWHYGWKWSGPEITNERDWYVCQCKPGLCGLIEKVSPTCKEHSTKQLGRAKQLHKKVDCPS